MTTFKYVSDCVPLVNLDPEDYPSLRDSLEIGQAFWAGILTLFPKETMVVKMNRSDWKKLKRHVMLEGRHLDDVTPGDLVWRYLELADGRTNVVIFFDEVRQYVRDIYEGDAVIPYHVTKSFEGKSDSYYKEVSSRLQELSRLCRVACIFEPNDERLRDFSEVLEYARSIQERRDALKREAGLL